MKRDLYRMILIAAMIAAAWVPSAAQNIPNPVLYLTKHTTVTLSGVEYIRYHFAVENFTSFPDAIFAAAPTLPPCGKNTKASRTWVDLYDSRGKRLNGFCAFASSKDLTDIWFALPVTDVSPSYIYIELNDRQTNTKYKSNLADTSL